MNKNVQDSNLKLEIKQDDEGKWKKTFIKKNYHLDAKTL